MARKRKGLPIHGWLNFDKPPGLTSTQALGKVRRLFNAAKAGHGGTLDPLATGVLPIAFGEATKTVTYAMDGLKTYRFTLRWGIETDTLDREGSVMRRSDLRPESAAIEAALPRFIGEIEQVPPAYSAIKVDGERAYDLARDGAPPELAARTVWIEALSLLETPDPDHAVLEMTCGRGTYVRALARDLAEELGALAHVASLTRTAVGPFSLDDAVDLAHLTALSEGSDITSVLLPVETPLDDIPAVALTQEQAHRLGQGQPVILVRRSDRERLAALSAEASDDDEAVVLAMDGARPVALARLDGARISPIRVLNL